MWSASRPSRPTTAATRAPGTTARPASSTTTPRVVQPEDVGQQVGIETHSRDDRRQARRAERREAHECRVDDRCAVVQVPPHEHRAQRESQREGRQDARAAPTPVVALDHAQVEQAQGEREEQRTGDVGQDPAPGRAALHDRTAGGHQSQHAEGQVDQERQPPAAQLDEGPPMGGPSPPPRPRSLPTGRWRGPAGRC